MASELFNSWLSKKLKSLNIDDEIFGSYFISILTSDDFDNDGKEYLKDILLSVTHDVDIDGLCCEILEKWSELHEISEPLEKNKEISDVVHKVAVLMEQQAQPVNKVTTRTFEEEQLREAILSRCTYISSEEEDNNSDEGMLSGASHSSSQNQNVEAVLQAEKTRREKMKCEMEKKKAQDKINRDKQKQKQEERKEKERKRTQKKEHKR